MENLRNKNIQPSKISCYIEDCETNSQLFFENYKWMTTNEAAVYLSKSTNAIRVAVCKGHLKARKFRNRLYFKRGELDELIETSNTIGG
tara:strand:- start:14785 stop:15051 length:267 start_codon:yes stop_codon:yes gene_type:complete